MQKKGPTVIDSKFTIPGVLAVLVASGGSSATTLPVTTSDTAEIIKALAALVSAIGAMLIAVEHFRAKRAARLDAGNPPGALKSILVPALLLPSIAGTLGCQQSPAARLYALEESYTQTLTVAAAVRRAGWMDDATYRQVESARIVAAAVLDALAKRAEGSPPDTTLLATLERAVAELAAAVRKAAHEPGDPGGTSGTGPSQHGSGIADHDTGGALRQGTTRPDVGRVERRAATPAADRRPVAGARAEGLSPQP